MIAMTLRGNLCAALMLLAATAASAQDFRVATTIRAVSAKSTGKSSENVGHDTALFHAGKVYDSFDAAKITIFEPAEEQFVILDQSRRLATIVKFDEIEAVLNQAMHRAEQKLVSVQGSKNEAEIRSAKLLKFQLHPRFDEEKYNAARRKLDLSSRYLVYSVQCEPAGSTEVVKTYLQFADWAARLNFVANQNSPLPGPRLELNQALLQQNVLPSVVDMEWRQPGGLHLKAEHKFTWKLTPYDREEIRKWEQLRHAPDLKRVPLSKLLDRAPGPGVTAKR